MSSIFKPIENPRANPNTPPTAKLIIKSTINNFSIVIFQAVPSLYRTNRAILRRTIKCQKVKDIHRDINAAAKPRKKAKEK